MWLIVEIIGATGPEGVCVGRVGVLCGENWSELCPIMEGSIPATGSEDDRSAEAEV